MSVMINFKICDNDKACSGMSVCPNGVFSWDSKKESLVIDNSKCTSCGLCEKACMVSAIKVAKSQEELNRIKDEIEKDPRSINDLLVERYGGKIIDNAMEATKEELDLKINDAQRPLIVELFDEDSIMCLLKSIPVKDIANEFSSETRYRKIEVTENDGILKKYNIENLPSLLFFKDNKFLGKIEGYYEIEEKEELIKKLKDIVKQ